MSAPESFRPLQLARPNATLHGIALGERQDFLLLHAGGEHAGVFKPVMKLLRNAGYGAAAFDQRGHGKSQDLDPVPLDRLADDAAAMIDGMDRPIVVGASLGGCVLMTALAQPARQARVRALVLLDIIPDPDPEPVRAYLQAAMGDGQRKPLVDHILSLAPELRRACQQLDVPVLLVRAGLGTPLTDESAQRFQALVPQSEIVIIEDAAHLVAQTSPRALCDVLIAFAARLGGHEE